MHAVRLTNIRETGKEEGKETLVTDFLTESQRLSQEQRNSCFLNRLERKKNRIRKKNRFKSVYMVYKSR